MGAADAFVKKLIDFLLDRLDLDAGAQQQSADVLRRAGFKVHYLAAIAGGAGIGDILARHLQSNLLDLQRVAGHLNGAEKRHRAWIPGLIRQNG